MINYLRFLSCDILRIISTNIMKYTIMGGSCDEYSFNVSLKLCTKIAAFRTVKLNV